jgi:integrase
MNSARDIVFKRCGCTDGKTGRQLAGRCPRLAEPRHGSWYYAVRVTTVGGRKARYRRGGFATRDAAAAARQAILDAAAEEAAAGAWTVARWLRYWLAQAEPHLRPSTAHGYRDHIDRYLILSIGRITLADLTGKRLQACFNLLSRQRTRNGTPVAASTVAVWTLRQLVTFLTGVEKDRLAALWWLIALRGLRRGEAAALDRDDLDPESRELTITRQLIALPGELYCGPPKSRASIRTIALDEGGTRRLVDQALRQTVELLRHQFTDQRRSDALARTGPGWRQRRPMFTYADGRPIQPEYLTHRFRELIKELDLPPIRLHDLRHGAATLALATRTDLKVIQQKLGHSSIVATADTCTSVLPETAHRAAQATADMVIKAARNVPGAKRGGTTVTHIPAAITASGYCQT